MKLETRRRTLSVREAAEVLGVHPLTLYSAIHRGELRVTRVGRRLLIPLPVIEDLLRGRPAPDSGQKGE